MFVKGFRRLIVWRSALPGRWRGGTGGRSSLIDCGVRLIFEGLLPQDPVFVAARCLVTGAASGRLAAHSRSRASVRRLWAFLVLVRAPAASRARSSGVWLVKGGGLPAERGELAGARDRDHTGGLAALVVEVLPALVQACVGRARRSRSRGGPLRACRRASLSPIAGG